MESLWVINILSNIVIGCLGWALKTLYAEQKVLRQMLQDTREDYVQKQDLHQMRTDFTMRFDRLENLILRQFTKEK
jgi:hypothetical protein